MNDQNNTFDVEILTQVTSKDESSASCSPGYCTPVEG